MKATNPQCKTWFRHVHHQNVSGDLKQWARNFYNTFIDASFIKEAEHVDWIQELNEYTGHGQSPTERAFWEDWAAAAAQVWHEEYRTRTALEHIRLIIGEPGIGNDLGVSFAQIATTYDCLIGYHSYIPVHRGQLMPLHGRHADGSEINEWKYYSGRWTTMDDNYRRHGYFVDWVAGEGGPIRDASPNWKGHLDPMGGWKHHECCSSHIDCYITALKRFLDLTTTWNKNHSHRFKGMTLFTSGAPGSGPDWSNFDLRQPDMNTIADYVAHYMDTKPLPPEPPEPPEPPPPPKPPPQDTIIKNGSFEQGWTDIATEAQQPAHWLLHRAEFNEKVRDRPVNGRAECVHLHYTQLPERERPGGATPLILDGDYTYKIFSHGATWRVNLVQNIQNLEPGTAISVSVPLIVHFDARPDDYDPKDTLITLKATGASPVNHWVTKENQREWWVLSSLAFVDFDGNLTVNIEISVKWEHPTAVFLDNITLLADTQPPPKPDPKCPGQAREQYNRTVLVAPVDASLITWLDICTQAYADRQTVSFSYDDAGIGNLTNKTAVLYDLAEKDQPLFRDWYKEHYPKTAVIFRDSQ